MRRHFWIFGLILLLSACGRAEPVEGNLILTNYASEPVANITVICDGNTFSSEEAISDTQLCSFSLPEKENVSYTVSFETDEGETVCENFTDSFAEGTAVYLRADRAEGSWQLGYDNPS